ncbi:hypothetical protein EBT16_08720 [bacterium]|nr:hypothetical protein [bacterium]
MNRFFNTKRIFLTFLVGTLLGANLGLAAGQHHRSVGEVETPKKRKKVFGSDREPAILNLNDEVEALSDLNAQISETLETGTSKPQEVFFNKFLVVDDKIILFGDQLTGVLTCSGKSGPSLVLSDSRQINTKTFKLPPGSRSLGFKDSELCSSALTVFKTDPKGQTRLIVVETLSEKVTRLDIR